MPVQPNDEHPLPVDLLIDGGAFITMNARREVIRDGAMAVLGDRIVAIGPRAEVSAGVVARRRLDGRRFVITPGFVDAHIHITGDPLTRGLARGAPGASRAEIMQRWVIPLFRAHTPEEEAISARLSAWAMLRSGTTAFLEAGTVSHLDAVMAALDETGIRGRLGVWVEGRAYGAEDSDAKAGAAIAALEEEIARWPDRGGRLAAWPILVGHSTNGDAVWRAAKALADEHGLGVSAHMSPRAADPQWFLANHGERPLVHLERIGALGANVALTHLACIDEAELDALIRSSASAVFCPHAAAMGGFGVTRIGRHPEMVERGVTLALGTDGVAADILSAARLTAGLFRDARRDESLFPPPKMLETAITSGARALGMANAIGALAAGMKADFVLHDTDLPEWGAVLEPVTQLALGAPTHGVRDVFIDGVQVLDGGAPTLFDAGEVLAQARVAGAALAARTGLTQPSPWPTL